MEARDIPRLTELHKAMNSTYPLPDLEGDNFMVQVLTDENDVVVMAMANRRTTEAYLLMDPKWSTPKWRFSSFAMLHDRVMEKLKDRGYTDVQCWIVPELVQRFGMKRLVRQFGWIRSSWVSFFREF